KMGRAPERLKALQQRLRRYRTAGNDGRKQTLKHLAARLGNARAARITLERTRAEAARQRLYALAGRMKPGFESRIAAHLARIKSLEQAVASLDHRQVLKRGFALFAGEIINYCAGRPRLSTALLSISNSPTVTSWRSPERKKTQCRSSAQRAMAGGNASKARCSDMAAS